MRCGTDTVIKLFLISLSNFRRLFFGDGPIFHQDALVERECRGQFPDALIHDRLGHRRFIGFRMAVTAIAEEINHHVLVEGHAVIECNLRDEQHRIGIVTVDMEDRCPNHFRHIGTVKCGARILLVARGKPDLVVQHDMHGALGRVAARLRHAEGFHNHALARKRRVTVDDHGQDAIASFIMAAFLACAHRALHHGSDDFEMGRIKSERHVHVAAFRLDIRRETQVIFHIAGAAVIIIFPFEFPEQLGRALAKDIHQHIKSSAVCHADNNLFHSHRAGALDHFIQHGTRLSLPSSEKRFCPTYLVCR